MPSFMEGAMPSSAGHIVVYIVRSWACTHAKILMPSFMEGAMPSSAGNIVMYIVRSWACTHAKISMSALMAGAMPSSADVNDAVISIVVPKMSIWNAESKDNSGHKPVPLAHPVLALVL